MILYIFNIFTTYRERLHNLQYNNNALFYKSIHWLTRSSMRCSINPSMHILYGREVVDVFLNMKHNIMDQSPAAKNEPVWLFDHKTRKNLWGFYLNIGL